MLAAPEEHFTPVAGHGYLIATLVFSAPSSGGSHSVGVYYAPNVTLSFSINGGSGTAPPPAITNRVGQNIVLPDTEGISPPDKYFLYGWSEKTDSGELIYAAGSHYTLHANATLYAVWSGDGSTANVPKLIYNRTDLEGMANGLNLHYKLMEDIDLGNVEWTPIGPNNTNPFTGSFDGNGKKISKLKVSSNSTFAGLFGYIRGDKIVVQNLHIEDVNIVGWYAGAVAGYVYTGSIQGCSVTGTQCTISGNSAGGIAGSSNSSIQNCFSTGAVSATGNNSHASGIAGYSSSIQDCVALNSSVSGSTAQRVLGMNNNNCTLNNNYGREDMIGGPWGNASDGLDGETVAATSYNTQAWWINSANWHNGAWDSAIWNFTDGSLPTLK